MEHYLSLLSWQGCKVTLQDFERIKTLDLKSPEEIKDIIQHPESKSFLIANKKWWKQAEMMYQDCQKKSYSILWPTHSDYPQSLIKCLNNPPVLSYIGNMKNHKNPIAFVGSRKSDQRSLDWMDFYIPEILKNKNVSIVSGGARGIDQKAHWIAIQSQAPTVCFLPSGLDHFYPSQLSSFKNDILNSGGAFVSSFPPHVSMYKSFFHIRNKLIASYSKLVVIVQAQMRSGTMLTAKHALNLGVPVATLPGFPLSQNFSGNLQLLYDGAFLLRDDLDLSVLIDGIGMRCDNHSHQMTLG